MKRVFEEKNLNYKRKLATAPLVLKPCTNFLLLNNSFPLNSIETPIFIQHLNLGRETIQSNEENTKN